MAVDYMRESAERMLQKFIWGGVALAVLGGVVLGVAFSAEEVNPWGVLAGSAASWGGTALTFIGLVGWGVKLGNEATMKPRA